MNDLRFGLRLLLKSPGFTFIAVLTLALGIGANTAIFSVVNAVFLEPLPYRDAHRVVAIWETNAKRPGRSNVVGPANFLRWQERATSFDQMAAFAETRANLTGTENPEEVVAQNVTEKYFSVLGVEPKLGRLFTAEENADPNSSSVILSEELWQRRFGSEPENSRPRHPAQRQAENRCWCDAGWHALVSEDRLIGRQTGRSLVHLHDGSCGARAAGTLSFGDRSFEIRSADRDGAQRR